MPFDPLAARFFGARDCPAPINLTLLRHCIVSKACKEVKMGNSLQQYRLVVGIYWSAFFFVSLIGGKGISTMSMSIVYSEPLVFEASVTTRHLIGCDIYQDMLRVSITLREFPFVKARKPLAYRADILRSS